MQVAPDGSARLASIARAKPPDVSARYRCYAVDDRPWIGSSHPAAAYVFSEDRRGEHPTEHLAAFRGTLQVDGYAGFGKLVEARSDASIKLAFCWAHARRPFYEFYTSTQSPLAAEVLARIAKLYAIEAGIRGQPPDVRQSVRQMRSRPLVEALQLWLQDRLPRVPGWSDLAKAMRYILRHWDGLILYLDDGRLEMDTNVVERAIRPVTITRKNSLFAGSDAGARRWAIANTLIQTCKLSSVEPLAWLTDVLRRIVSGQTKNHELHTLLPCWGGRPNGIQCANIGSNNQPSERAVQWNSNAFRLTHPSMFSRSMALMTGSVPCCGANSDALRSYRSLLNWRQLRWPSRLAPARIIGGGCSAVWATL